MQTLTFTQKLLRQRSFFSFLLPLLAIFAALGSSQKVSAQAYAFSNLTLTARTTSAATSSTNTYYVRRTSTSQPLFAGTALGGTSGGSAVKFDPANGGVLTLDASAIQAAGAGSPSGLPITSANLFYRVYLVGTGAGQMPSYSVANLADQGNNTNFANNSINVNLLTQPQVLGGGDYAVEIYFVYTYNDPVDGPTQVQSPGSGTAIAFFSLVSPAVTPPGGSTTWISTTSNDWTLAANWSNGVPTRFSDAIIPEKNSTNTNTVTPALLNPDPNLYEVRTITLNGTSNATRALLRIGQTTGGGTIGATLNVYGDLNTFSGGILAAQTGANGVPNPALNSTIALKGGDQVIRGLLEIADIRIEGTGVKAVVNAINASNVFVFSPGVSAIVRTVSENRNPVTGVSTYPLNTTKTSNVNLKSTGVLLGETNTAFIEGVALADRNLQAGVTQTFGNIGVDITPNRDITGPTVQITRTVGDPLSGPIGNNARPVKRQYGVSGDVNNAPTLSTVVFHYLDRPDELNGNDENNLVLFRTANNGIPYDPLGGQVNTAANTVTRDFVANINTITLGDKNNPLPVTLTSFEAKKVGTNALLTWQSANERNNKGYNVQVSTDGKSFRTLGFVSSESPNSTTQREYSYTDVQEGKTGIRYYRLEQVDLDGKTAQFAARAVNFGGKAAESTAVAYPSPLNSGDQLRLALGAGLAGTGQIRVLDMTGRTVSTQSVDLEIGANDVEVARMGELKAGIYMVNVTLPSGETKKMKVVKQ
ncbi:T9SS type A sorting domain-containing protein [Hymenobacter ruricola]|uniref:T9SS type A sorting domain-containing protein n=1 Tax=Hymenobacter ruricola TaxID=2791023 RepID=A0ABS0I7X4_9BACT|nr:T9SS type A sorting domain-containing protein [Hymenobacter ruricola]MBF9222629.1 T9SS type A sorting domain-containing protein [Hymenobacter ruricola]